MFEIQVLYIDKTFLSILYILNGLIHRAALIKKGQHLV